MMSIDLQLCCGSRQQVLAELEQVKGSDRCSTPVETSSSDVCPICLQGLEDANGNVIFTCGHVVHEECVCENLSSERLRHIRSLQPLKCPFGELCTGELGLHDTHSLVQRVQGSKVDTTRKAAQWHLRLVQNKLLREHGFFECLSLPCQKGGIVFRVDGESSSCCQCRAQYCGACSLACMQAVECHSPMSCKQRTEIMQLLSNTRVEAMRLDQECDHVLRQLTHPAPPPSEIVSEEASAMPVEAGAADTPSDGDPDRLDAGSAEQSSSSGPGSNEAESGSEPGSGSAEIRQIRFRRERTSDDASAARGCEVTLERMLLVAQHLKDDRAISGFLQIASGTSRRQPQATSGAATRRRSQATSGAATTSRGVQLSSEETVLMVSKFCPGCESRIQRSGGCRHMTCRQCQHEFCWSCLKPYRGKGACTSFSCNAAPDPAMFEPHLQQAVRQVNEVYQAGRERDRDLETVFGMDELAIARFQLSQPRADTSDPVAESARGRLMEMLQDYAVSYLTPGHETKADPREVKRAESALDALERWSEAVIAMEELRQRRQRVEEQVRLRLRRKKHKLLRRHLRAAYGPTALRGVPAKWMAKLLRGWGECCRSIDEEEKAELMLLALEVQLGGGAQEAGETPDSAPLEGAIMQDSQPPPAMVQPACARADSCPAERLASAHAEQPAVRAEDSAAGALIAAAGELMAAAGEVIAKVAPAAPAAMEGVDDQVQSSEVAEGDEQEAMRAEGTANHGAVAAVLLEACVQHHRRLRAATLTEVLLFASTLAGAFSAEQESGAEGAADGDGARVVGGLIEALHRHTRESKCAKWMHQSEMTVAWVQGMSNAVRHRNEQQQSFLLRRLEREPTLRDAMADTLPVLSVEMDAVGSASGAVQAGTRTVLCLPSRADPRLSADEAGWGESSDEDEGWEVDDDEKMAAETDGDVEMAAGADGDVEMVAGAAGGERVSGKRTWKRKLWKALAGSPLRIRQALSKRW